MFQIPGFRIPQPNCFTIPVSELLTWGETSVINKQTKLKTIAFYEATHTMRQFRYFLGDQKIDPNNVNVLLLENVEEQKRNNEMPKGTQLGKTEQETAFR